METARKNYELPIARDAIHGHPKKAMRDPSKSIL
jgi:hypothetical protein